MLLSIVHHPAAILATSTSRVEEITPEILRLMEDMAETMYAAPGVGLASNQVGRSLRLFVADDGRGSGLLKVLNPVLSGHAGAVTDAEGCLSVPDMRAPVKRYERVTLDGIDEKGTALHIEAEGWLARVFQHEVDHLDGKLYLDHLGRLARKTLEKQYSQRHRCDHDH
jgi:peptide deformylase